MEQCCGGIRSSLNMQMINTRLAEYGFPKRRHIVQFKNGISLQELTTRSRPESPIISRTRDFSQENYSNQNEWDVRSLGLNDREVMKMLEIKTEGYLQSRFLSDKDTLYQYLKKKEYEKFLRRIRISAPGTYACLIAGSKTSINAQFVGVVDAIVMTEERSLPYLRGAKHYVYISGLAVRVNFRRKNVATTLLKACEELAKSWGYSYLVLKVYQEGAQELFLKAGYQYVSNDHPKPKEKTVNFVGDDFTTGTERVMIKQVSRF